MNKSIVIFKHKCKCHFNYCNGDFNYHKKAAVRIKKELDALSNDFAEDGIVRFVLRQRIIQEKERGQL